MEVEPIFLSLLGSVNKLKWYLDNQIDLVDYIYKTSPGSMGMVDIVLTFISKSKRKELLKDFNTDRILGILKRQRPNLYKVLVNHQSGRRWLGDQIKGFRRKFL